MTGGLSEMGPESRDSQGQPADPDEPIQVRIERDHRRVKTDDWGIVRRDRYRFASRNPGAPGIPVQGAAPRALP
jgi:hypothetical protein